MNLVADLHTELAGLADPKILSVNQRHGDDHAVNLTQLRAVAKRLKTNHELAVQLWASDDSAARLLALLICRPKNFAADELDQMMRQARTPKVQDWLTGYVVLKGAHADELRRRWFSDSEVAVASAGWAITSDFIAKGSDHDCDLDALLTQIEAEMKDAPERLQWAMNTCLAQIGIAHPEWRERAIAIGEKLEVLKDYPTSKGCTSPFAPIWIAEIVRRQSA